MLTTADPDKLLQTVITLADDSEGERLVRNHLERAETRVTSVRTVGVRPKGVEGGVVTYAVDLEDGTQTFASARVAADPRLRVGWDRLESERSKWRGTLKPAALIVDEGVLLTSFPIDRGLPWLRPYTEPEKAKGLLLNSGVVDPYVDVSKKQSSVALMSYRSERRAVLKWSFACKTAGSRRQHTDLFVRIHSESAPALRSSVALSIARAAGVPAPPPLIADADRGIAVEGAVGGGFARAGVQDPTDAFTLGQLAAQLHRLPAHEYLPKSSAKDRLDQAARAVRGLGDVDPVLGGRAHILLSRLQAVIPSSSEPPRLLHGDLHPGQYVVGSGGAYLIDFDRARGGHPAQDIGSFLAHLVLDRPEQAATHFISFSEGYSTQALWFEEPLLHAHVATELLCLADAPFRRAHSAWQATTGRMLDQVDTHVDRAGLE